MTSNRISSRRAAHFSDAGRWLSEARAHYTRAGDSQVECELARTAALIGLVHATLAGASPSVEDAASMMETLAEEAAYGRSGRHGS